MNDRSESRKHAANAHAPHMRNREERRAEYLIVAILMLVAAFTAAYYGFALFPEGSDSGLALAIPGLIAAGAVYALYFISRKMLKRMTRRK